MRIPSATIIAALVFAAAPGCKGENNVATGDSAISASSAPASIDAANLLLVQEVFAELLKIDPQVIRPDATIAQLGADELDLVEAVMEIEDRLKISIPDEELTKAAGTESTEQLLSTLTVSRFADVVTASRNSH